MSVEHNLPYRPRLADHAQLRRRFVDGAERFTVFDWIKDTVLEIDERSYDIIRCADGTRDLGGVVLEAVRQGVYRRASEIQELLVELNLGGLLADGIEVGDPPLQTAPERPLEVLDGFTLTCDSNGTCCSSHGGITFLEKDIERARAAAPEILSDEADRRRGFVPLQGAFALGRYAVTMIDGRCPYLREDGLCRIQVAAGAAAKPKGCRVFPSSFVDDGTAVRVSVLVECPCVLASVDVAGGTPLVPEGAEREGDLVPGCYIQRIPTTIQVSDESTATRDELRQWADTILECDAPTDPLTAFWSLADGVRDEGFSRSTARAALKNESPPPPTALSFPLMLLSSQAQAKADLARVLNLSDSAGTKQDSARLLTQWTAEAASSLLDNSTAERLLASPSPFGDHERFYFKATIFGHHILRPGLTIERALRDSALRLLLARRLGEEVPEACANHPAAAFPITVVESMMRGQGIDRYMSG